MDAGSSPDMTRKEHLRNSLVARDDCHMKLQRFDLHPAAMKAINDSAAELAGRVVECPKEEEKNARAPSQRHPSLTLSDKDIIGVPSFGDIERRSGRFVTRYSYRKSLCIGLDEDASTGLRRLVDQFYKIEWVQQSLGQKFLEESIFDWCLDRYVDAEVENLSDYVIARAREAIKKFSVWVPVAFLEVEAEFSLGLVKVAPVSKRMMDEFEAQGISANPAVPSDEIAARFFEIRKKYQGCAAIVVSVEADSSHAVDRGWEIADAAIGLLRLFSDAAGSPWDVCPWAILGSEIAPSRSAIVAHPDQKFSMRAARTKPGPKRSRISRRRLSEMQELGLNEISGLIAPEGLNEFASVVRGSVLTYSKGLTFPGISDRLVYAFSSLESLLLRDSSEPIQQNLGERMAFLLKKEPEARREIVRNVKDMYKLRSGYVHHGVSVEQENELDMFWLNAWTALLTAVGDVARFSRRVDFIDKIDDIKFGGGTSP